MKCGYQKPPTTTYRSAGASKMKRPTRTSINGSRMHPNKQGSTMHKQHLIPVDVPGEPKPVLLPPTLASALKMIIVSDFPGIDTFELQRNGIRCVRNTIYRLRKRDIRLETIRVPAYDNTGNLRDQIGHYSHEGSAKRKAEQRALNGQKKLSVFNKLAARFKFRSGIK